MGWLREQLRSRGISQVEADRAVGLNESQMSKVMNGSRRLTADEADGLRRFLGYRLPDDAADTPEARIIQHLAKLGADQKRALETYLQSRVDAP